MIDEKYQQKREPKSFVLLSGAKVTASFRDSLFDACNRAGITPNEFAFLAVAEKLKAQGKPFTGLFRKGDLNDLNGGMGLGAR